MIFWQLYNHICFHSYLIIIYSFKVIFKHVFLLLMSYRIKGSHIILACYLKFPFALCIFMVVFHYEEYYVYCSILWVIECNQAENITLCKRKRWESVSSVCCIIFISVVDPSSPSSCLQLTGAQNVPPFIQKKVKETVYRTKEK